MNQVNKTGDRAANLLVRLWRGQVSLVISYWIFGVVGGFIWDVAFATLELRSSLLRFLFLAGRLGYFVVVYVGVWRAAEHYTGRKEWAFLAKLVVVVSVIFLVRGFASSP
jgi:hypothetical protein